MKNGPYGIMGLKLIDVNNQFIYNEEWHPGDGDWVSHYIPEGREVIGLKWRFNTATNSIWRLGFLIWKP